MLENTRNDRSAEIEKLMMKLTESDENDGKAIKLVNNDLSDGEDCFLEYAKSEYADRYFFYFSRLIDLFEDMDDSIEKEFNKYNSKKTSEIKKQLNLYKNDIKNINGQQEFQSEAIREAQNKNKEQQKILNHPLTKFYKNEAQIEKIKKEIDKIKKRWKRQYYKFIFAYMLECPGEIWKLRNVIKNFDSDVQFKFIEFLLKHTDHQNFAYTCYKFDNLLKRNAWLFRTEDQSKKIGLKNKYNKEIENLGCNTLTVVDSLLSDAKKTFLDKHMCKSWVLLGWTFGILLSVIIAPILIQLIIDFIFFLCFLGDSHITAGLIYRSTAFATIFWITVATFAIAIIFWAYKGHMHSRFEKNLKHPPKEKDLSPELNQNMSKKKTYLNGINSDKNYTKELLLSGLCKNKERSSNEQINVNINVNN